MHLLTQLLLKKMISLKELLQNRIDIQALQDTRNELQDDPYIKEAAEDLGIEIKYRKDEQLI